MKFRSANPSLPILSVLSALVAVSMCGCGSAGGPEVVPVSGVVHNAGEPLADATVTFMPISGRPSTGSTDAEGRFTLRYTTRIDGAAVGKHNVTIATGGSMPGPPPGASPESGRTAPPSAPAPPTEYVWPETVDVSPESDEFDFDLVLVDAANE